MRCDRVMGVALVCVLALSAPADAQDSAPAMRPGGGDAALPGPGGDDSRGGGEEWSPSSGVDVGQMNRMRRQIWNLEQLVRIAELRRKLARVRDVDASQGDDDDAAKDESRQRAAPKVGWRTISMERYGDRRRATITSRLGRVEVEPGQTFGAGYRVKNITRNGVEVVTPRGQLRTLPFESHQTRQSGSRRGGGGGAQPLRAY